MWKSQSFLSLSRTADWRLSGDVCAFYRLIHQAAISAIRLQREEGGKEDRHKEWEQKGWKEQKKQGHEVLKQEFPSSLMSRCEVKCAESKKTFLTSQCCAVQPIMRVLGKNDLFQQTQKSTTIIHVFQPICRLCKAVLVPLIRN